MALQWYNLKLPDGRVKEVWCDPEDPRIAKGLERVSKEGMSPSMEAEIDRRAARLRERQAGRSTLKEQET